MKAKDRHDDKPSPRDRAPRGGGMNDSTCQARGPHPAARHRNGLTHWNRELSGQARLRTAGALATSLLAAAFLTACSLNAGGQDSPSTSGSPSLEAEAPDPTDETDEPTESDEPTDEDSTEASNSSNAPYLCGGLLSEQFLKDELSFTPSRGKYTYRNERPDEYSAGNMSCRIHDQADDAQLVIEYDSDTTSTPYEVNEAESNADGKWQTVTIDGQNGKGWVKPSTFRHHAAWVDADGYAITVEIFHDSESRTVTAEKLKALLEKLVGTTPKHNETAEDVHEYRD